MNKTLGQIYLEELEMEMPATRKCLERITEETFDFKPHEKSMIMKYLALIVSDIPRWITHIIEKGEIDFGTYGQVEIRTTKDLVDNFDKNMKEVKRVLQNVGDEAFKEMFSLKNRGQLLASSSKEESVSSSINHLVHHRGQLTVYMRLCEIPVPSIYGPSADDKTF